jgi:hypothetical protein
VLCPSTTCGEDHCPKVGKEVRIQYGEKSAPNHQDHLDNTSTFDGVSNLNFKADHSVNVRAECEKRDASIVSSSEGEKSVQGEDLHTPTQLKFETEIFPNANVMPRCDVPSTSLCEILDSSTEIMCSDMSLNVQIEGKISVHG